MNQYFMFIKKVIKKIVPNLNMQFMCQEMEKKYRPLSIIKQIF